MVSSRHKLAEPKYGLPKKSVLVGMIWPLDPVVGGPKFTDFFRQTQEESR